MALFRRRFPLPWGTRLKRIIWPYIGVRRAWRYWGKRLIRLSETPHAIALGVAFGVAVSFTPLLGMQWALALLLALVFRASLLGATVGTLLANPWTYPLIWSGLYKLGQAILQNTAQQATPLPLTHWRDLIVHPGQILIPMAVGAAFTAPLSGIAVYYLVRGAIVSYRKHKKWKKDDR